jgi:competence CoiA-like predicted nuclease
MIDRKINYAKDKLTEGFIDLGTVNSKKEGFVIRNNYNTDTSRYICKECDQQLVVANSANDNIYFRHHPYSEYCILKDSDISEEILKSYREVAISRESPRHKELKNKIGKLLYKQDLVDLESIDVDSKFLVRGNKKRRPDVFCRSAGKDIAFEIQLSSLPLHYIMHRYDFYKKNDIYLFWILDFSNSPRSLDNFQRDIKYIWSHQNLFILDESRASELYLICHYKESYIFNNESIRDKWKEKSISFHDLKFNNDNYSCYYNHFEDEKQIIEAELSKIKTQIKKEEREKEQKSKEREEGRKVSSLLQDLKQSRERDSNLYYLKLRIISLNHDEVIDLNKKVDLDKKLSGVPTFLKYIHDYKPKNNERKVTIVEILLSCQNFEFDINLKDDQGNGVLKYLYNNPYLDKYHYLLKPQIFERKYKLDVSDKDFFLSGKQTDGETQYLELSYYQFCDSTEEMKQIRHLLRYFLFIESAIQMRIIGSNLKNWVQYIVPIMSNFKHYWKYTVIVLNKTPLGRKLQEVDKKGTIKRKIKHFNLQTESEDENIGNILFKIYPEIFF